MTHVRASPLLAGRGRHKSKGTGWQGNAETDIPAVSFPKHVLGLHSGDDLAFHKDFEVIHSVRSRMRNGNSGSGGAASTYPDILNGGNGIFCTLSTTLTTGTVSFPLFRLWKLALSPVHGRVDVSCKLCLHFKRISVLPGCNLENGVGAGNCHHYHHPHFLCEGQLELLSFFSFLIIAYICIE